MALTRSTDPLVWIDCEMTGLDPKTDSILSIACFVTDYKLDLLEPNGFEAIIHHPQSRLDKMDEWCTKTHSESGLSKAVVSSTTTAEDAARGLRAYIKNLVPQKRSALLAGNSVHADRMFLMQGPWAGLLEYLHYRILDVSAIKEGVRRWCPEKVLEDFPRDLKRGKHEARADILESIEEGRWYMELLRRL